MASWEILPEGFVCGLAFLTVRGQGSLELVDRFLAQTFWSKDHGVSAKAEDPAFDLFGVRQIELSQHAAVFLLDYSGSYAILRAGSGESGRTMKERGHRLRVSPDSMVGYAVTKREPRVALNAGEDVVRFANPLLPDTQSEIALPLIVGDQTLGALDVQSTQLNAFDDATVATLQNVADQITIALQNAQEQYLGLPVGWNFNAVQLMASESCAFAPASGQVFGFNWYGECRRPFGASASTNGWAWILIKLAGLLMTAVASAQGSSFWFDVLMKVVNVRSAGIKPAG